MLIGTHEFERSDTISEKQKASKSIHGTFFTIYQMTILQNSVYCSDWTNVMYSIIVKYK